jgi:outer membrane protein OmpA-like peptidoglycan-associated protein
VVEALKRDYSIDGGRMRPAGVGMTAPTATNDTENGRAKDRRVKLVKLKPVASRSRSIAARK